MPNFLSTLAVASFCPDYASHNFCDITSLQRNELRRNESFNVSVNLAKNQTHIHLHLLDILTQI